MPGGKSLADQTGPRHGKEPRRCLMAELHHKAGVRADHDISLIINQRLQKGCRCPAFTRDLPAFGQITPAGGKIAVPAGPGLGNRRFDRD